MPHFAVVIRWNLLIMNAQLSCFLFAALPVRLVVVAGEPGGSVPAVRARIAAAWDADVLDHAGATAELAERLLLPIEGPQADDQFWIDQMPAQAKMFGFPPSDRFTPDRWLVDGDRVNVGEVEFEVLHCPGHTPGHVVFFQRESRFAIVGDVIFAGSIGRTDFPRGNHDQLLHSIRDHLFPLGDDVTFLPGHGPTSTFGAERQSNPFVADRLFAGRR